MNKNMKLYAAMSMVLLPCLVAAPEIDKNKSLGSPTAPVRIEIFSDFTCPHCKHFHEEVLPQLMKDYVIGGKVYVVDRAFPLTGAGHEHSREAFAYAVAAARIGKYQQVGDALYANQATWAMGGNVWATVASALPSPADQKKVQELTKDPGVMAEIEAEYQYGAASGIIQTPTLILTVGGRHYNLPPAPDYRLLKSMIDGFLPK
jgi:protein-disulfide isomerase